jgi:RHS repeat-associated protein
MPARWGSIRSREPGISSLITTSIPYSSAYVYHTQPNATGDGFDALVARNNSLTAGQAQYYLHNGAGQPPDLVSGITDGYGNSVSPTYISVAQGGYATNSVAQPTYPYVLYVGPTYALSRATFSDPASGSYYQSYSYLSAWTNLQGRGLTNFKALTRYDSRNQLWEKFGYANTFPLGGLLVGDVLSFDETGNQPIRTTFGTVATVTLAATANNQRYFVYSSGGTTSRYEVGGTKAGQLIRTEQTSITSDNFDNPTTISTVVTDSDSSSPYSGNSWTSTVTNTPAVDTVNWCLSLFSQTQTSFAASDDSTAVTRTRSFTPDTTHCRYSQIVTEPASGAYKVTEALGYDAFGNVNNDTVTGINMVARTKTTDWGATGQFPMTVRNALNQPTTLNYDFSLGLITSQADPNNLTTTWQYDSFGRKTQELRPDGTTTVWNLADCAPINICNARTRTVLFTASRDKNGGNIQQGDTQFDSLERPFRVWSKARSSAPNSLHSMIETDYDSLGRISRRSFPCLTGNCDTPAMYFATTLYDALDRPTQVSRPQSAANGTSVSTNYQYAGDTRVETDANSHARTFVNDSTGRLRRTTDASGYSINFGYDAAGSQTSITDSLGNTLGSATYQYGVMAMRVSSMDADLGASGYTFDALGEVTVWTDAKSQHFSAAYDPLARLTDRYEPDLYTHWTWGTSAVAHEIGQLNNVCTGTGTNPTACSTSPGYAESETYDALSRWSSRTIQIPGDTTYTYSWTYDAITGLPDTLTYPADAHGYRLVTKYGYAYGLLSSVTDTSDSPNKTLWTANSDNERGQFTQETLGNNVIVNSSFDAVTGLINNITAGVAGSTALQNNSYLFDAVGNFTQRQDNRAGTTENIYMDPLNRLDHTVGDTAAQMGYDSMGRLSTWSANGATPNVLDYATAQTGCTYYGNSQPHAVRRGTMGSHWGIFCYDANGNRIQTTDNYAPGDISQFTWTSYNQPASMSATSTAGPTSSSQFFYDHNHQRWKQIASYSGSPETTEYIGGLLEKMTNASTTAFRYYVPAGSNTIVYSRLSTGTNAIYYLGKDHLGSTATISDQNGTLVATEKFAALGWNEASAADQTALAGVSRHEFTGHEGIDNAGLWLVNMDGRIYEPSGTFFLSPDPTIPHPTDTRSYNRYAYVNYNPLTLTDPSGYDDDEDGGEVTVTGSRPEDPRSGIDGGLSGGPGNPAPGAPTVAPPPLQEVVVAARRKVDPYFAIAFDVALVRSFETPVCQSIGYMICIQTSRTKAAALAKAQGILAALSGGALFAVIAPQVVFELLASGGTAGPGGALVTTEYAAYNYGTIQTIAGYEVGGTAGMVGSTYSMNIWALYATEGAEGMGAFANAIRAEATALGATEISITGNAVINPGIMNMGSVAARYGFGFSQINSSTVWLWATLP